MSTYQAVADSTDRDEWLEARKRYLTATDLSRLASGGRSEWLKLKAEKNGTAGPMAANQYMQWGNHRERTIADWAESNLDDDLHHNTMLFASTVDERIAATPDMIDGDDEVVADIKTHLADKGRMEQPPQNYVDQLMVQMYVMGAQMAYLVVEEYTSNERLGIFQVLDFEPTVFMVPYDADRMTELLRMAGEFLAMGESATELDVLLSQYALFEAEKNKAQQGLDEVKADIEAALGDRGKYVSEFGSVTKSTPKPSWRPDTKRLKDEYPAIWDELAVESQSKPRLTIRAEGAA